MDHKALFPKLEMGFLFLDILMKSAIWFDCRFGKIIIGTGIETFQFIGKGIAGGQHQNRCLFSALLPQFSAKCQSIHTRQHNVQCDGVIILGQRQVQSTDTVQGKIQHVTLHK